MAVLEVDGVKKAGWMTELSTPPVFSSVYGGSMPYGRMQSVQRDLTGSSGSAE